MNTSRLSPQNPWPGPDVYGEAETAFFFGREAESAELARLVQLAPLTVLYGNSGLGKSSLLLAGLFPVLRRARYLPVYLRLDYGAEVPPLEQAARRLEEEIARLGADAPARQPGEDLWTYLHRADLEIWSADNYLLTPVLVFDQFEELFARAAHRVADVFHPLADLIENRIPSTLPTGSSSQGDAVGGISRRRIHQKEREQEELAPSPLDLLSQRYRVLLAFREDYLPEVETWKDSVPSVLRNRLRLLPMSREQAIEATEHAGAAVLAAGMAAPIVDFVARRDAENPSHPATVEPVLLSLCCTRLNQQRPPEGHIDNTLLQNAGPDILDSFYQDALKNLSAPAQAARFIESHLIQGDRYRGSYPRAAALTEGALSEADLAQLTDQHRLLRVEQQADTARLELIHDRLVEVVRAARDARLERDARLVQEEEVQQEQRRLATEAEAVKEKQLRRRAEKMRNLLAGVLVLLVLAVGWAWRSAEEAKRQTQRATIAETEAQLARAAQEKAEQRAREIELASLPTQRSAIAAAKVTSAVKQARATEEKTREEALASRTTLHAPTAAANMVISGISRLFRDQVISSIVGSISLNLFSSSEMLQLTVHGSQVNAVAFSPDGHRIVSGSGDKTLRLWDAQTGQPIGALMQGHTGSVTSVAFSPDSSRIVSGSGDKTLRLWDAQTGQSIGAPIQGHTGSVTSVAFSPDGRRIVSGSRDKTLRLWDAQTGQSIGAPMQGHTGSVTSVAFSPDGRRIVSGSRDKTLRLWDAQTGQPIGAPMQGHTGSVTSVAFSPDGRRIVSGSRDKTLRLWDAQTGRPIDPTMSGK